jgi:sec-independent protein translocase protein TatA
MAFLSILSVLAFLGGMRGPEILIIALVLLLLFGGRKIPELMRGLGKGMKEFKDATTGDAKEGDETNDDASKKD